MFKVSYKTFNGEVIIIKEQMSETAADLAIQVLSKCGFSDVKKEKLWQLAKIVLDMQKIPAAKDILVNHKEEKGVIWTYGDPDAIVKEGDYCKVKNTNGTISVGYVMETYLATADEVKAYKEKIGYKHLGVVMEKV